MSRLEVMSTREIELRDVSLSYRSGDWSLQALDGVSLSVRRGELVTLLGPNGCGKSTLLKLVAGLLPPSSGQILHRGQEIGPPDGSRMLMFQDRTLFPWSSVRRNIGFGLRVKGVERRARERRVRELIEIAGLQGFENALPHQLSSGMRQRAELARALAVEPSVLLLDEPFAAVDSLTRDILQEELLRHQERWGITLLMVTHDIREAAFLSDRILLMSQRPGSITRRITVDREGGRTPDWRAHPRFGELCYEILTFLREEIAAGKDELSARVAEAPRELSQSQ